jgi:tRNA pseudouridine38-40 synthase
MVTHARVPASWTVPPEHTTQALNSRLPFDIRVIGSQLRDDAFHARFDAIAREYTYTISRNEDPLKRLYSWQLRYEINPELLVQCAELFVGTHDFTTFSKRNAEVRSYICTVSKSEWLFPEENVFRYNVIANRFVYGMVRALVGCMIDVARLKRSIDDVRRALEQCDRNLGSPLAPAQGLVFERVYFPEHLNVEFSRNTLL